jgi:dihydrolipoamide dehydrogenase
VAVEHALGQPAHPEARGVPGCVFADPEVGSVGLSEAEAREQGYEVRVGKFPFVNNGKALAAGEPEGFVKVVSEAQYGQILGLHVVGAHASDLILEGGLALTLETTVEEIAATVHAHPTLGEAVLEATLAVTGRAIHSTKSYAAK